MAQVLIRDLDDSIVESLKTIAANHGRSLQTELKLAIETHARKANKAEARALAARIRRRIRSKRRQTDSGILQAEDRER